MVDFRLCDEDVLIQDTARDFADKELVPNAGRWDKEECFPKEAVAKAAELGFLSLSIPENYGGVQMGAVTLCVLLEELNRVGNGQDLVVVHVSRICTGDADTVKEMDEDLHDIGDLHRAVEVQVTADKLRRERPHRQAHGRGRAPVDVDHRDVDRSRRKKRHFRFDFRRVGALIKSHLRRGSELHAQQGKKAGIDDEALRDSIEQNPQPHCKRSPTVLCSRLTYFSSSRNLCARARILVKVSVLRRIHQTYSGVLGPKALW